MADQPEENPPQESEEAPTPQEPMAEEQAAPAEQAVEETGDEQPPLEEPQAEETNEEQVPAAEADAAPTEQAPAEPSGEEAPVEQAEAEPSGEEAPVEQAEAEPPARQTPEAAEETSAAEQQAQAEQAEVEQAPAEAENTEAEPAEAQEGEAGVEEDEAQQEEENVEEAKLEEDAQEEQEAESPAEVAQESSPAELEEAEPAQAETEETSAVQEEEEQKDEQLDDKPEAGEVSTDAVGTSTGAQQGDDGGNMWGNAPDTSRIDKDATATVKFVLMPGGQVVTLRCHLGQTFAEMRAHFSTELKMPVDVLILLFDGKATSDTMTLGELGVGPNGTIRLELQSSDPVNNPLKPFRPREEHTMPDVITVRVPAEEGGYKDVVVEIERTMRKKPFLGGYKHKETGVEYHHAGAQTIQKQRAGSGAERFCRDTQTMQQKHIFQQTTNNTSTQMTKIGVFVSNMADKLVVPGKYTTADEHKDTQLKKIVVIQKYYRRWLSRRFVDKVRVDKARRIAWEREEEVRKRVEREERIKKEFERRMNPKTKEDFDLLYHALEKWRKEEVARINAELSGAERKAALCQLLEQETQLIASVGRHKLEADHETRNMITQTFLDNAAAPKRWRGPDGKMTEMDTPYTIRAQQLRDIYNSINMKYLTQDERLDVLLTLKHTVKEHDCKLTQEIIELIDREADLLMRGVKEANLDGLRKRIATLFLQYIKTPTFNPEAARLIKVPQDSSTLRRNIYFCSGCNQYLPSTEFQLSSNSRAVGKCRTCTKMDNEARVRQDYSHYRFLLKNLRRAEDAYDDGSKIAFLLQEGDLRYLVENVWNSQSILSAYDDLYDLTLVRWILTEEWSPWNCILLTKEEASAHEKLENLEEAYGKVFIHRVQHKHTLARQYFSRLPGMSEHMRTRAASSSLAGQSAGISGKRLSTAKGSAIKAL